MAKKYELDADGAYKYILDYLDKFDRTEMQIRIKLKEKGFDYESRNTAVEKAKEYGFIDDDRFSKRYIEMNSTTKGKRRIRQELSSKGISQEIIDKYLGDIENEAESCYAVAEKFLKNRKPDEKLRERLFRRLVSRGFSYSDIKATMNKFNLSTDD